MALTKENATPFQVYVRWRPLSKEEADTTELNRDTNVDSKSLKESISLTAPPGTVKAKAWNSGPAFTEVFEQTEGNRDVYERTVKAMLPTVLSGGTCNLFAYGHSGSGKTHTVIGYEFEDENRLGLSMAAAKDLFRAIQEENEDDERLSVAVRLYEVRGSTAFDLLNGGTECHVREGSDGRTHIRGATEMLEEGKVRVRPILAVPCHTFQELQRTVLAGLKNRATGSSSVHDESSRTHAILELEIVNQALTDAREALVERESELVPVGKKATDIYLEEQMASLIKDDDGKYIQNPERPVDQARVDAAEAEKAVFEARVKHAEDDISACFRNCKHKALGGKFVFVDLAGAEYFEPLASSAIKQTPLEKKQGRQINTDLFTLKEVIRARAEGKARVPYRGSPLTMVLRSHFQAGEGARSAMILTVSPSQAQYGATMNTLKYGNLVGMA